MEDTDEDYLADHPRYQQLKYLSRGLFGYVVLAMDKTKGCLVSRARAGSSQPLPGGQGGASC